MKFSGHKGNWKCEMYSTSLAVWFTLWFADSLEDAVEIVTKMEGPRLVPEIFRLVEVTSQDQIPVALL